MPWVEPEWLKDWPRCEGCGKILPPGNGQYTNADGSKVPGPTRPNVKCCGASCRRLAHDKRKASRVVPGQLPLFPDLEEK